MAEVPAKGGAVTVDVRGNGKDNSDKRESSMKGKVFFGIISAALFSIGSLPAWAEDKSGIEGSEKDTAVNCATARDDVATLKAEKKKTSDRAVDGIFAITPIGLVTNLVTGGDKMGEEQKMDAEEYNKLIDQRIEEIQSTCGGYFSDENIVQ